MLDTLLSDRDVEKITGRARSTLQKDRVSGTGIKFVKIGRLVRYRESDVRSYLAALPARRSTSEGSATCKSNEATCESWAAARTFAHRADELTRGTELSVPAKGKSPAAPGLGRLEHESLPMRSSSGPHRPDAP